MGDWFKFYNNGLDEPRFQYAISEHPQVVAVWLLILSGASREYSGTFSWRDKDYELFGYARKLNITVPVLNECLNMLCKIEYISKGDGVINILKWNDMQSEYCQKNAKKKTITPDVVPTKSRQSPLRGEEKRVEKIRKDKSTDVVVAAAPTTQHAAFIKGWSDNFEAVHKVKYQVDGGRDGKAVKSLLAMGILVVDLLEIAKKAWAMKSNVFLSGRSLTIHGFRDSFNEIQTNIQNPDAHTNKINGFNHSKTYVKPDHSAGF